MCDVSGTGSSLQRLISLRRRNLLHFACIAVLLGLRKASQYSFLCKASEMTHSLALFVLVFRLRALLPWTDRASVTNLRHVRTVVAHRIATHFSTPAGFFR